ncbi:MAG: ComF family protein [Candidatus Dormibacteria bacterium]
MLSALLDTLAPRRCAGCALAGSALCRRCVAAIDALPQPAQRQGAAAFPYGGVVRSVLWRGKFRDQRTALRLLADIAAARLRAPSPDAVVVPIPLAPARRRARGYNQAEVVARVLAQHHDLEVAPDLLRRARDTAEQSRLHAGARTANVAGAFAASAGAAGRTVWLVDDVRTTGATTDAATVALEAAGADRVEVAVLAAVL